MLDTPHPEEIINGEITDYCCILSKRTLSELKLADAEVVVEASVRRLPVGINRAFLYGVNDVALLADSKGIRLIGLRDGDIFLADEPVLLAQGRASDIATIRSSITGILSFSSSYVTRMARLFLAAYPKNVSFFDYVRSIQRIYTST